MIPRACVPFNLTVFLNTRRDDLFWPTFYIPQKVLLFGVVAFE